MMMNRLHYRFCCLLLLSTACSQVWASVQWRPLTPKAMAQQANQRLAVQDPRFRPVRPIQPQPIQPQPIQPVQQYTAQQVQPIVIQRYVQVPVMPPPVYMPQTTAVPVVTQSAGANRWRPVMSKMIVQPQQPQVVSQVWQPAIVPNPYAATPGMPVYHQAPPQFPQGYTQPTQPWWWRGQQWQAYPHATPWPGQGAVADFSSNPCCKL